MVAIQLITAIIFQSPPVKCKFIEKDDFFRTFFFFLSTWKQEATQVPINERCVAGVAGYFRETHGSQGGVS